MESNADRSTTCFQNFSIPPSALSNTVGKKTTHLYAREFKRFGDNYLKFSNFAVLVL